MNERPILFSAPMILAILEDRKTQTRRVCTPTAFYSNETRAKRRCPYGAPGDKLWVRETFTLQCDCDCDEPPFNDRPVKRWEDEDGCTHWLQPHYRATDPEPELSCERVDCNRSDDPHCHWRPSIFMPRWASRITLEITDIRVQHVGEISGEDAEAEGCTDHDGDGPYISAFGGRRIINNYARLWDSINAKRGFPWEANPFVWVLTFRRCHEA